MMRHLLPEKPAVVVTCDECSGPLRDSLPVIFLDVKHEQLVGANYCVHCAHCGTELFIPCVSSDKRCYLHGVDCPDLLPKGTTQGAELARTFAAANMELTDAAWAEVGEALHVAGPHGVDVSELAVRLCEEPDYLINLPSSRHE